MKVILASASPRRQDLLTRLYRRFEVIPADVDETIPEDIGPEFAPIFLSAIKAEHVAEDHPDDLIIAADTVVILDGKILGKPKDDDDAVSMLKALSGKTHKVITGCCIKKGERCETFSVETYVSFYDLTETEIRSYVESGLSRGKAGAYGIQDQGAFFVEKIDGDYYNVVGFPISRLKREIDAMIQ